MMWLIQTSQSGDEENCFHKAIKNMFGFDPSIKCVQCFCSFGKQQKPNDYPVQICLYATLCWYSQQYFSSYLKRFYLTPIAFSAVAISIAMQHLF